MCTAKSEMFHARGRGFSGLLIGEILKRLHYHRWKGCEGKTTHGLRSLKSWSNNPSLSWWLVIHALHIYFQTVQRGVLQYVCVCVCVKEETGQQMYLMYHGVKLFCSEQGLSQSFRHSVEKVMLIIK